MIQPSELTVNLQEISFENWRECVELSVRSDQRDLICNNAESLAESGVTPGAQSLGIFVGSTMVGLVVILRSELMEIHRFMVDHRWQGRGVGKQAIRLVLKHIQKEDPSRDIVIKFLYWNNVAEKLYVSVGFVDTGVREGNEKVFRFSAAPVEAG
jgi:diamine N-acetyltransferase